jgi:hypothetical protein
LLQIAKWIGAPVVLFVDCAAQLSALLTAASEAAFRRISSPLLVLLLPLLLLPLLLLPLLLLPLWRFAADCQVAWCSSGARC